MLAPILIFNGSKLYYPNSPSLGWASRSGPFGKGAAPPGVYEIGRVVELAQVPGTKPFTDYFGFAWWAKLFPTFTTERTGLGIHPDGNVPGTLGCIGVKEPNSKPCFIHLQEAPRPLYLVVLAS